MCKEIDENLTRHHGSVKKTGDFLTGQPGPAGAAGLAGGAFAVAMAVSAGAGSCVVLSTLPARRRLIRSVMKTCDIRNDQGQLTGFSVSNLLLSRHGVPRIVEDIPGAKLVRKQKRFALSASDDFCEFIVDGKTFLSIEPFGDSSDFWVVTEPPEECPQIETVRRAFEEHRLFGRQQVG